jgi:hypothetical protein
MNRIIFILTLSAFLFSQQAEVTNIQAAQRTDGSQIVDITYDLTEDEIFEEFTITVEVSFDGGSTFTAISNATGDFGEAILPGLGKTITWNFGQQFSDTYSDQVQYKITAISDAIVVVEDEGCDFILNLITVSIRKLLTKVPSYCFTQPRQNSFSEIACSITNCCKCGATIKTNLNCYGKLFKYFVFCKIISNIYNLAAIRPLGCLYISYLCLL